jgi:hypothetical protein
MQREALSEPGAVAISSFAEGPYCQFSVRLLFTVDPVATAPGLIWIKISFCAKHADRTVSMVAEVLTLINLRENYARNL